MVDIFGKRKKEGAEGAAAAAEATEGGDARPAAPRRPLVALSPKKPATPLRPDFGRRLGGADARSNLPATVPAPVGRTLVVGRDISLSGEIRDCERLLVEGSVEAALIGSESLIVAEGGSFRGPADVQEAEISGTFDGDLTAHQRLVIAATGKVSGRIRYREIEIIAGGCLAGQVECLPRN